MRRGAEWAQVARGLPVCRAVLVPAISWGRVLGCLLFGREAVGPPFRDQDLHLATAMAENVALALEYAETFRSIERQADQIRRLNQDLEDRNARLIQLEQLRKDLGQMIVHDMRGPLTAIIGAMQWVEREAGAALTSGLVETIRVGRRSAQELLGMVNELLEVARMEGQHPALDRTTARLDSLVEEAVHSTSYLVQERRLQISIELPLRLPNVSIDRSMIVRVLVNLIGNAVKFTPPGGRITVAAAGELPGLVAVTVADTGEGIPLEFHDRIFEKFGQVASRRGGRSMSTGLGLTFCKLAVEAHGGQIGVQSMPGEGARFTFTLPTEGEEGDGRA